VCARHGAQRCNGRCQPIAKASRGVTWRCKSSGDLDDGHSIGWRARDPVRRFWTPARDRQAKAARHTVRSPRRDGAGRILRAVGRPSPETPLG
jgi:hypothetical protein